MKKKKGAAEIMIMTYIGIFFFLIIYLVMVKEIYPHKIYTDIRHIVREYALKMESDGYLSPSNYTNLQSDLTAIGLNPVDVTIEYTSVKVPYGSDVFLNVTYNYKNQKKNVNGLYVTETEEILPIKVEITTTSKNGS